MDRSLPIARAADAAAIRRSFARLTDSTPAARSGLIYTGLDDTTPPQKFWAQTARDTLTTLLWCAYLLKSKRVRATFVKRRRVVAGDADASLRAAIQPNQQHAPP